MNSYLYDLAGHVIAFRRDPDDPHVFDLDGHWLGWQAWDDRDVAGPDGGYLGTIVCDRLVRRNDWWERPAPDLVPPPRAPRPTGTPLPPAAFPYRFAYEDVALRLPYSA